LGGRSFHTEINQGGVEDVTFGGVATNTVLHGGTLDLVDNGVAQDVDFVAGHGHSTVKMSDPTQLQGTISHMQVGDAIRFNAIGVTSLVQENNDTVTMSYISPLSGEKTVTYHFENTQDNTRFTVAFTGHDAFKLILVHDTPLIGIADAQHHGLV
jgi:autotransporter passenger strand-loop-strand repeat protein